MNNPVYSSFQRVCILLLLVVTGTLSTMTGAAASGLDIDRARYDDDRDRLTVKGDAEDNAQIDLFDADSNILFTTATADGDGNWRHRETGPAAIPCRVRAESQGDTDEKDVQDADEFPGDCGIGDGGGNQPPLSGNFTVLGANDLGMHCADLDYQIFSILPPFNVVHAQVIEKGAIPRILDDSSVSVTYKATANPNDPAGAGSINTTSENLPGIFKTNFWDSVGASSTLGAESYDTLYPGVQVIGLLGGPDLTGLCADPVNLLDCPSALTLFGPIPVNLGIPVPDAGALFPANPADPPLLITGQQVMPGLANIPQEFDRFDVDLPFFVNLPFGFRGQDVNWFAADGIPALPVDDTGRPNAYPLMEVAAHDKVTGQQLASVDVVLPVASEADCQNCHVEPLDCAPLGFDCIGAAIGAGPGQTSFNVITLDDNPPGETALEQLLNVAKINVLRLHDAKHGTNYENWDASKNLVSMPCDAQADASDPNCLANQTPVQCSQCHYSPALDLAQAGPVNEPEQGLDGRQQVSHISMSRSMHGVHGNLPDFDSGNGPEPLFPPMPGPDDPLRTAGLGTINALENDILGKTCYQCHPGKQTQCLRGTMFSGGVVCQDCHGDMQQVGNDFTIRVSHTNPGDFVLDGSLRVPWASEPGCQSCHTGDAVNPNHPNGAIVADDGLRLLQAYKTDNIVVPGVAGAVKVASVTSRPDSRFAENQALNSSGGTVDVLYRLSKEHGGVMCEACHNSTHAIWPNPNPFANDNIASRQLQGHTGTIMECDTCHEGGFDINDFRDNFDANGLMRGPHGMHPAGTAMWVDKHKEVFKDNDTPAGTCESCHGVSGEGTVLARMAETRTMECDDKDLPLCNNNEEITLAKGTPVSCDLCHENEI